MVSKKFMIDGNNDVILIVANTTAALHEFCAKEAVIRLASIGKVKLTDTYKKEVQKNINVLDKYLEENL